MKIFGEASGAAAVLSFIRCTVFVALGIAAIGRVLLGNVGDFLALPIVAVGFLIMVFGF